MTTELRKILTTWAAALFCESKDQLPKINLCYDGELKQLVVRLNGIKVVNEAKTCYIQWCEHLLGDSWKVLVEN
jgi:hypothetical protein